MPCDAGGRLHLAAVAADGNLAEMKWQCSHGLQMEVLSWKIYVEEPGACVLISNALNKYHQASLRTTELTALAVLTGEVTRAMESNLADAVAFETIKENVR